MKAPIKLTLILLTCSVMLFTACGKNKVRQYTVDLTFADGTQETYAMVSGQMLHIHPGDQQFVVKMGEGSDSTLAIEVTNFSIDRDSANHKQTIRKTNSSKANLSLKRKSPLDASGMVSITVTSMVMIDIGRQPRGACKGKCCEATCFTTSCCSDPDECKNAPCNCTAPGPCPGQPPSPQAAHFFELFNSGKDMLVVADE